MAIFGVLELGRIGASRCLSVAPGCASVDSTKIKIQKLFLVARLGWFSVADVTRDFWNCAFLADTTAGVWPIGLGVEHQAQIRSFLFVLSDRNTTAWSLEERPVL